ncbi:MAG: flagellar protein FlgN [Planctomycetes bacterium]|nr:flagellar protein FlgN [Planctomycetota bacterium]
MDRNVELRRAAGALIEALGDHLHKHRELATLLERKKEALVTIDLPTLESAVDAERRLIDAIGDLEGRRIERTAAAGRLIGHPRPTAMRMRELIPYIEDDQAQELLELRDSIRAVADRLDRLNALARTLASHSIDHIRVFLAVARGQDPFAKDYTAKGTAASGVNRALYDRRI